MADINYSSSVSRLQAKVELYNGSALVTTCTCDDILQGFTIEQYGEDGKFFGSIISQKITITLFDFDGALNITPDYSIRVSFIENDNKAKYPYPTFYAKEITRNEDEGTITVVAYDGFSALDKYTAADLTLAADSYYIRDLMGACVALMPYGTMLDYPIGVSAWDYAQRLFSGGVFLRADMTVKQIIKAVCEYLGVFCYIKGTGATITDLVQIKGLTGDDEPATTITKEDYYELKTEASRQLAKICHTTELGDNIESPAFRSEGETQYIRNNPILEAIQAEDANEVGGILSSLAYRFSGHEKVVSITPFYCDWDGSYSYQIGDKIAIEKDDGSIVYSYLLNNKITYDGTYSEVSEWSYEPEESDAFANPSSLGEVLNETFARVDKAEKEIKLYAGQITDTENKYSSLQQTVDTISADVSNTKDVLDDTNNKLGTLTEEVSVKLSKDNLSIVVREELEENGVEKVSTSTGFTFDENGLLISKSDSLVSTQITENGMRVYKEDAEVLEADDEGVWATNLHATTFLIIGENSRLQDSTDGKRTACYWIGG